jgi:hypothetical protein
MFRQLDGRLATNCAGTALRWVRPTALWLCSYWQWSGTSNAEPGEPVTRPTKRSRSHVSGDGTIS